ncbi:MAG TPA: Flp family type IVb pilin [Polyangia bacterium]
MFEQLKKLVKDEEAPTAVEYALLVAAIALVMVVGAALLGKGVDQSFDDATAKVAKPS